jgi:putative Mn2+ efflux pump MntP
VLSVFEIAALAVALAMDALAVSVAAGVALRRVDCRQTFRLAWHFGFFQALMTVVGWAVGLAVYRLIAAVDHWVAFGLLLLIGGKMIVESRRDGAADGERWEYEPTRGWSLVLLSLATSIDALAAGLSLSLLRVSIWLPALVIGLVAGLFTVGGLHLGALIGRKTALGRWAELAGGVVLVLIGIWVLYRHGVFC